MPYFVRTLQIPQDLDQRLRHRAITENRSVAELLMECVREGFERLEANKPLTLADQLTSRAP